MIKLLLFLILLAVAPVIAIGFVIFIILFWIFAIWSAITS